MTGWVGVIFDEGSKAPVVPRAEPALVGGQRLLLDNGFWVSSAKDSTRVSSFQSLPAYLGGGFFFSSADRFYTAESFLGPLKLVAEIGEVGRVRNWLQGIWLQAPRGSTVLEPQSGALFLLGEPFVADAVAVDAQRAARLDVFGRAEVTTDAGHTWTDLLETKGFVTTSLTPTPRGVELTGARQTAEWLLSSKGLEPLSVDDSASRYGSPYGSGLLDLGSRLSRFSEFPSSFEGPLVDAPQRVLAPPLLGRAAVFGALLPSGHALVVENGVLYLVSTQTGMVLEEAPIANASQNLLDCEPAVVGDDILLACNHEGGAHVLRVAANLDVRLEATFHRTGRFSQGLGARFGFEGACGNAPPTIHDFSYAVSSNDSAEDEFQPYGAPAPTTVGIRDLGDADVARFCQRLPDGHWIEHTLHGKGASQLYLWLPGDNGAATALLLLKPGEPLAVEASRGVTLVTVNPNDPALKGALFPDPLWPPARTIKRHIERTFRLDAQGTLVQGWLKVARGSGPDLLNIMAGDEDEEEDTDDQGPTIVDGSPTRLLPVSVARGGVAEGVQIDAHGKLRRASLPNATEVVYQAHLALAKVEKEGVVSTWESTDYGMSFHEVQGPPTSEIRAEAGTEEVYGCGPVGCTFGEGVVRVGWGGPAPEKPADMEEDASLGASELPPPFQLVCTLRASAPLDQAGAPTLSLVSDPDAERGGADERSWSSEVFLPFASAARPSKVTINDPTLGSASGVLAPFWPLGQRTPGLYALSGDRAVVVSGGKAHTLEATGLGAVTSALELKDGATLVLDGDQGVAWLANEKSVQPVLAVVRGQGSLPNRFFLGRDAAGNPLVVGVSMISGELFSAPLDLTRGVVGRPTARGSLRKLALPGSDACKNADRGDLVAIEASGTLGIRGDASYDRDDPSLVWLSIALVDKTPCIRGAEASARGASYLELSARFGPDAAAVARVGKQTTGASCLVSGVEL